VDLRVPEGNGTARHEKAGEDGPVMCWRGLAGMARHGLAWKCGAGSGTAGEVRKDGTRLGWDLIGKAGNSINEEG
jgi:hypothetical protein